MSRPRIAVLGAGPTGLTNALLLAEAGFDVTVFEASGRIGGKINTYTGFRHKQQRAIMEKGPEFIDGHHEHVQALMKHVRVKLDKVKEPGREMVIEDAQGRCHSEEEVGYILEKFWRQAIQDSKECLRLWPKWTPLAEDINKISMDAYMQWRLNEIDSKDVWAVKALRQIFASDFGLEPHQLNALSFVTAFGSNRRSNEEFSLRGESDERYKVSGGMARFPEALKEKFLSQSGDQRIMLNCPVHKIARAANGHMKLFFRTQAGNEESCEFDTIVSAVEPASLRRIEGAADFLGKDQWQALGNASEAVVNKIAVETKGSPHLLARHHKHKSTYHASSGDLICTDDPDIQAVFTGRKGHEGTDLNDLAVFYFGGDRAREAVTDERVERLKKAYADKLGVSVDELFTDRPYQAIHKGGAKATSCYVCPMPGQLIPLSSLRVEEQARRFAECQERSGRQEIGGLFVTGQFIPAVAHRGLHIGYLENGVRSANEMTLFLKDQFKARLTVNGIGNRERTGTKGYMRLS